MTTESLAQPLPEILTAAIAHRRVYGADQMSAFFCRHPVSQRKLVDLWIVRTNHQLGLLAGTPEHRFLLLVEELFTAEEVADGMETGTSD